MAAIRLIRAVVSLQLSPAQNKTIAGQLNWLEPADQALRERQSQAALPVAVPRARLKEALMAGQQPSADDEAKLDQVTRQVAALALSGVGLRSEVVSAIRTALNPEQINQTREAAGIIRMHLLTSAKAGAGGPCSGPGPAGANELEPGRPRVSTGGIIHPPFEPGVLKSIMDSYRRMPEATFEQNREAAAAGHEVLNYNGVVVTDPLFAQGNGGVSFFDQMLAIRQIPANQYQATKGQVAAQLSQQFNAAALQYPQLLTDAMRAQQSRAVLAAGSAAETELSEQAISYSFAMPFHSS
jgi:hypothetical protein